MTDNDAFARLKTRSRATVPARNSSLTKFSNDTKTEFSHSSTEDLIERSQDFSSSESSVDIAAPTEQPSNQPTGEVTRRTLRISRDLDEELESLCNTNKITRETFLEAAYLACQHDPNLMESVLAQARQRYLHRKQTGERRKFATMQGKFTD